MGELKSTAEIEAVADALRRGRRETPSQTAARILRERGITPAPTRRGHCQPTAGKILTRASDVH